MRDALEQELLWQRRDQAPRIILVASAVIAILLRDTGWQHLRAELEQAPLLLISACTLQELLVVAHFRSLLDPAEALLLVLDPDVVPVDGALARPAALLFQRFGKGQGHAAQLNVGDCFAAALAEREPLPLAFARGDFSAAGF